MTIPPKTPLATAASAQPSEANGTRTQSGHRPPDESIGPPPAPVWLQRLSLVVLVIFCLYLGLLIAVLPWWSAMWEQNELLLQFPTLRALLMQGPVRGLISGLGILDLWIGISELIHYRDYRN